MKSKMSIILKILKISIITILSIIVLINLYIIFQTKKSPDKVPSIFGYKPLIVLSGSMEPTIMTGDLVFVKNYNINEINENDIIAFKVSENTIVTHRIVKKIETESNDICFETKGDANNTSDKDYVCSGIIEGKYEFKLSKLGTVLVFIQKPLGFTIMMMSIFILGMIIYIIINKKEAKKVLFEDEQELKEFEEFKKQKLNKQ